jgi:multidrug transporter EmrE-like cation transporter
MGHRDRPIQGLKASSSRAETAAHSILGRWWIAFSLSSICVVGGHLMIKAGLNSVPATANEANSVVRILHILMQPQVVGGLFIYLVGTACWMIAVSQKEISFLYPLSSVNYVLVAAMSALFLAESISIRRGEGMMLIIIGMFLLNRRPRTVRA